MTQSNVTQHQSHSKTGTVFQVRQHLRTVDRHALVAAMAHHLGGHANVPGVDTLHAAVERAIDQHHEASRVKHVRHENGAWRTSNTKPAAEPGAPQLHVGGGKVKLSVGGKVVHEQPLIAGDEPAGPAPTPVDDPVLVQPAGKKDPGFTIPPEPTPPPVAPEVAITTPAALPAPTAIAKKARREPGAEKAMRAKQALWQLQDKVAQVIFHRTDKGISGYIMTEAEGLQHRHAALKEAMGMPLRTPDGKHRTDDYGYSAVTESKLARAMEIYRAKVDAIRAAGIVQPPSERRPAKPAPDTSTVFHASTHNQAFAEALVAGMGDVSRDAIMGRDLEFSSSGRGWSAHVILHQLEPNGFSHKSVDFTQNDRNGASLKDWGTNKVIWRDKTATTPGSAIAAIAAASEALKAHLGGAPTPPTKPTATGGEKGGDADQASTFRVEPEPAASDTAQAIDDGNDGSAERWVPTFKLNGLKNKLIDLNKKAKKLGLAPLELTLGDKQVMKREVQVDFIVPGPGAPGGPVYKTFDIEHTHVTISGESPRINGWTPLGVVQHGSGPDGKPVNVIQSFNDKPLPAHFIYKPNGCDHCKKARERSATVILQKGDEVKQVGKSCLKDFTGHADPQSMINRANFLGDLYRDYFDPEDDGLGRMKGKPEGVAPEVLLAHTAHVVAQHGWVSKGAAQASVYERVPLIATIERVKDRLEYIGSTGDASYHGDAKYTPLTSVDHEVAAQAHTWAKGLADKPGASDYELKLAGAALQGEVGRQHQGILASAIAGHQRHKAKQAATEAAKAAEAASPRPPATHVGTVGEKHEFAGTLQRVIPYTTDYGNGYLYKFADPDGNSITWPASKHQYAVVGQTYQVTGTVKAHKTYRDTPETTITRGAIRGLAETDEQRDARVAAALASPPPIAQAIAKHVDPALRGEPAVDAIAQVIGYGAGHSRKAAKVDMADQEVKDLGATMRGLAAYSGHGVMSSYDTPNHARLQAAVAKLNPAQLVHATHLLNGALTAVAMDGTRNEDTEGAWLGHHGVAILEKMAGIAPPAPPKPRKKKEAAS